MIEVKWRDYTHGSCMYCSIDEQYDSLDPKTMNYIGPARILHITFEDARQRNSYATIRVCFNHLCDLDDAWSEKVEIER